MKRKKQRGQKRKVKALLNNINQFTPLFEELPIGYDHFHVPCGEFISAPKTSAKIKSAFCKAWLEKTAEIIEQKPDDIPFCKVVGLIDVPDFWQSQIIIFYDKDYYDTFWTRNSTEQTWTHIKDQTKSFVKARNIKTGLNEIGYTEIISEPDFYKKSELWLYGDI